MIDRIIDELKKQNLELNEHGMKELKENETALVCFAEKYEMSVGAVPYSSRRMAQL